MERAELRAVQDPLKDRYRAERDTRLRLTERYCVVLQTLAHSPQLSFARAG
jgi:hypothetical protein